MALRVYNTLSRDKSNFETLEEGKVRMYVCGPTVYDSAHVGHAMSALVFDVIRRYLIYSGYDVQYVMNFTDVDDKIIDRAQRLGIEPIELAEKYIDEFKKNLSDLNILPATEHPRATEEIDEIIKMVSDLLEKETAYEVDGDVFFRVEKAKDYGKPWGPGRPGWHIECSAMNLNHLGNQIDIHGGGNDLIFPHHENEIAQTEAITGKPFARYWMHNGMLQLKGEKMSKSTGNLVPINEFIEKHTGDVMRLIIISSHYRSPLTFNSEVIEANERALERLLSAKKPAIIDAVGASDDILEKLEQQRKATQQNFIESMNDDFNTAGALGQLFDLVRMINQARSSNATDEELSAAQQTFNELTEVLGLTLEESKKSATSADSFIELLLELRQTLRKMKNYDLSDQIRDQLADLGVMIEDTPQGSTWHWE